MPDWEKTVLQSSKNKCLNMEQKEYSPTEICIIFKSENHFLSEDLKRD